MMVLNDLKNTRKNILLKMTKLFSQTLGKGPDLVLLHGWGVHSGIWQSTVEALSKDYRITSIDLPGFGRSEPLIDNSIENIIEAIINVAPEKAIWVGWSLGGLIAIKLAYDHPRRVAKLVCVASSPRFIKSDDWPGIKKKVLQKFADDLNKDYVGTLTRFLLLQFYGTTVNKALVRSLEDILFLHNKPSMKTLDSGLKLLKTLDLRQELQQLNCEVLYILGRLDMLVPQDLKEALHYFPAHIKTIVLPKASHGLFLSHEEEFLTHIRQFANG